MPLQHPQQCLICRRTQIEMDSQAQKIARNGHWSVKMSTSTNAHKFHSLLATSHIFHELWMFFLEHKVSVFGVDLDRGKKRQKVTEGPTCLPLLQLCIPSPCDRISTAFQWLCNYICQPIQIQRRGGMSGPSSLLQFCISSAATLFQESLGNLNIPFEYFHWQLEYSQV